MAFVSWLYMLLIRFSIPCASIADECDASVNPLYSNKAISPLSVLVAHSRSGLHISCLFALNTWEIYLFFKLAYQKESLKLRSDEALCTTRAIVTTIIPQTPYCATSPPKPVEAGRCRDDITGTPKPPRSKVYRWLRSLISHSNTWRLYIPTLAEWEGLS